MTDGVFRFARRKTTWESRDVETICKVEFRDSDGEPDLRPSVYEIDESALVQTYAEHAIVADIDPPGSVCAVDVSLSTLKLLPDSEAIVAAKPFRFSAERHREIELRDEGALHALVASLCANADERLREVLRVDVRAYVVERLSANDREWRDAADSTSPKTWLKKLAKKATAPASAVPSKQATPTVKTVGARGRDTPTDDGVRDVMAELAVRRINGELSDAVWLVFERLRVEFGEALPGAERDAVRAKIGRELDLIIS